MIEIMSDVLSLCVSPEMDWRAVPVIPGFQYQVGLAPAHMTWIDMEIGIEDV